MKNNRTFLSSAIILTLALVLICVFMPEWGVAQILIVILVAILAAAQWVLYFWIKRSK